MLNRLASLAMSTSILQALPGKLDIKRHNPSIFFFLSLSYSGGTVDITIHQVKDQGRLKELHKASGGAWGGTKVDDAFRQLLVKIVTDDVFLAFQRDHTDDYLDLFREFEIKKRDITPDKGSKITFKQPSSIKDLFQDEKRWILNRLLLSPVFLVV